MARENVKMDKRRAGKKRKNIRPPNFASHFKKGHIYYVDTYSASSKVSVIAKKAQLARMVSRIK